MFSILPATGVHLTLVETLLDQRFGPARRNRTAYRLRDGVQPLAHLSFVAMAGDTLVGSVQCWPLRLKPLFGARLPLILLGPMAVARSCEGQGIASALMRCSLAAIDAAAEPPVLLIGDAPFYGRFGFSAAATRLWSLPGPVDHARLLLRGPSTGLPRVGAVEAASGNSARAAKVA
ncbi:MAG: N-acetyltransferase [Alphaproteobacteria bacterium]|nr:N-acetyltransferase [Alphaproteobacteria bacterium]